MRMGNKMNTIGIKWKIKYKIKITNKIKLK